MSENDEKCTLCTQSIKKFGKTWKKKQREYKMFAFIPLCVYYNKHPSASYTLYLTAYGKPLLEA